MAILNSHICAFSILFMFLGTQVTAANTTLSPIFIPGPPGPYLTGLQVQVMVDTSRPDPYNSSEKYRRIVTSVFTPVPRSECTQICNAQYMPPATAAFEDEFLGLTQPLFERFQQTDICCAASAKSTSDTDMPPLLIWSPGFGESRLEWSIMAQYVASYGYEVVTVDHPGDSEVTEFPDGEIVKGIFTTNATAQQRDFALNVETADVLFVIDAYSKGTCGANKAYGFDKKVGILAHGAIAAQAMLNDSLNGHPGRIAGGVNFDGRFNGPVLTEGLGAGKKSFLLWVPPTGPANVTSWNEWWNITDELNPADWRKEVSIANSLQGSYTDYPLLADVSGLRVAKPKIDTALGTISGARITSILTTYNVAFFDMVLKGEMEPLLSGPNAAYPEVSYVRSST